MAGDPTYGGRQIACPACQKPFTIPHTPGAVPASPSAPRITVAAPQAKAPGASPTNASAGLASSPLRSAAPSGAGKTSGLAVASLVCSLLGGLGFIPAIICGHMAKSRMRRDPSLKGRGMATWGLALGYVTLASVVLAIGALMFVGATILTAVQRQAQQRPPQTQSGSDSAGANDTAASDAATPDAASAPAPRGDPLWMLDLSRAQFPDHPAAGKVHGLDFKVESAKMENGILTIRQGKDFFAEREMIIFLFLKPGESIQGKSYQINQKDASGAPTSAQIHINWMEPGERSPKPATFSDQFAMKLEFGQTAAGKLPFKIYLCLPDKEKSYVAGNFELGSGIQSPVAGRMQAPGMNPASVTDPTGRRQR
ncbi:MAG TPA: DUF4190 domain-containing protein [Verrucomicrobiae bacterium]|nr:DUF4190 domain-containing protein [Verrucomicrobiae bacterium]